MAKALTLIGIVASLAAQVLLVAFLLNIPPVGIDYGDAPGMATAVGINLALIVVFGALHSVMARPAFKSWWTQRIPERSERGIYLLVAGVTLAGLCHLWQPIPLLLWQIESVAGQWLMHGLFAAGLALVLWSIVAIDALHFHGIRQAFETNPGEPEFSLRGPYRAVRHPIQTGLIVALWATPSMSVGHALFAGALTLYSVAATLALEEPDLRRSIGAAYDHYRQRVPALIPWRRPLDGRR